MNRILFIILLAALCAFSQSVWAQDEKTETTEELGEGESKVAEDKTVVDAPVAKDVAEEGKDITSGRMGDEKDKVLAAPIDAPDDADEAFKKELVKFEKSFGRYSKEISDYQKTVGGIVDAEYTRRVAKINTIYDSRIKTSETIERDYRLDAIATFEKFLEKYPREDRYTPDAKFRLAELYFEKANDDFLLADEQYQVAVAAYESGESKEVPINPERDYAKTMSLFRELIADWPDYRLLDGAYYLLAYTELQMGNVLVARDLFAELIRERPDSQFVPEAWIRIGEYHFDVNELEVAKTAYGEAMKFPESKYYDKALYKLAWTYYRQDNFDQSIKQFKTLVEYSDKREETTGQSGSVLREESILYIAISLAEEDWDLDGNKDDDFGIIRVKRYISGDLPYEREVLTQLGEYLFDNTRYTDSIDIYRFLLARYPMDRRNPEVHEKIILALLRDENLDAAFAERGKLSQFYGSGSEWYAFQERVGNVEATRYAMDLVKDNLIQSATWYHAEAQKARNEALVAEDDAVLAVAKQKYKEAAVGYADFLKKYPNDKDFYQWNFYYAECLYYSDQFNPAFEQYRVVREMDVSNNQYQEVAAFNAVKSMEFILKDMIQRGEVPAKTLPTSGLADAREAAEGQEKARENVDERDNQKRVIKAETVHPKVLDFVTSMDRYVVLDLKNPEDKYLAGKFAFQSAKIFYDFKDYPEARKRFEWIVNEYPENEIAYLAGSLILETYREENDFENLALYAEKLGNVLKGEQAAAVRAEVREFKLGALFKSAEQLFAEEKYEAAAEEYVRLLKEDPDTKYAAKALNNAAVAYENVKRYESAMKLYERVYKEHPKDPLASYALYRMAINQERFFDFENAVQSYLLFYDKYKNKPQSEIDDAGLKNFDLQKRRGESLQSAAVLEENLQNYRKAGAGYEKFVNQYPNHEQAADTMWQAHIVWEKAGDTKKMIAAIEKFNREYGGSRTHNKRVLEGMTKIADYHEKRGKKRDADKMYKKIIAEFNGRGIPPGDEAAFYAAKSDFMLVEREYDKWAKIQIKGSLKKQKKLLKKKVDGQKALNKKYEGVFVYRSLEWTMAAAYRKGKMLQEFAASLYEVPIPFKEDSEEYEIYRTQLEDIAIPLEDEAIKTYEKNVEKSRQDKIVNEWTKRTLEELNKYKPKEYPLFKEERRAVQSRKLSGREMYDAAEYDRLINPPDPKPSEKDNP